MCIRDRSSTCPFLCRPARVRGPPRTDRRDVPRRGRGALRAARARLRAPRVPEQDQPRAAVGRRRRSAQRADAGVLRLLRLALVRARPLAAGAVGAHVSRGVVRRGRADRAATLPDRGEHRGGGPLPEREGPGVLRAPLWPRLAAAARRRAAQLGRPGGACVGARAAAAERRCARARSTPKTGVGTSRSSRAGRTSCRRGSPRRT